MTEDELLGLGPDHRVGPLVDHPAGRYAICAGEFSYEEAAALGASLDNSGLDLIDECWIDPASRTLHHGHGCTCVKSWRLDPVAPGCRKGTSD